MTDRDPGNGPGNGPGNSPDDERPDDALLETWLRQLEVDLSDTTVIARSEFILKMNTQIHESLARGDRTLAAILATLGEPAQVADRYRLENGFPPVPRTTQENVARRQTSMGAFFKWATIGILGFFSILVLGGILLVTRFLPLVKVDENANRVRLFGGLIDFSDLDTHVTTDTNGRFKFEINGDPIVDTQTRKGEVTGPVNAMRFSAGNARLVVEAHSGSSVKYQCQVNDGAQGTNDSFPHSAADEVRFDFSSASAAKCAIQVPYQTALRIDITNGDVKLTDMRNPLSVRVGNGLVVFNKQKSVSYSLNANATNGSVIGFEKFRKQQDASRTKGELFSADITVANGNIRIE